jgi:hypothetical protein
MLSSFDALVILLLRVSTAPNVDPVKIAGSFRLPSRVAPIPNVLVGSLAESQAAVGFVANPDVTIGFKGQIDESFSQQDVARLSAVIWM